MTTGQRATESPAKAALAFDIYGTLIDTGGVVSLLDGRLGPRATRFSELWRQKQLEYSFRRAAMGAYRDFSVCTAEALEYACAQLGVDLDASERDGLLAAYRRLPAFPEVKGALLALQHAEFPIYAFSNGLRDDVESLLNHAGIADHFMDVISVDEVRSFKPSPAVYRHMLGRVGRDAGATWMISSNPFDILGAANVGLQTAWVRRSSATPFDPWGQQPTVTVSNLLELKGALR